jgi:hypothetical protein
VETVRKNFTGLSGPNDKNYGLSRRMIDIYLLCLLRAGKLPHPHVWHSGGDRRHRLHQRERQALNYRRVSPTIYKDPMSP